MKKIILFALLLGNMVNAQTINGDYLDLNNIKAQINPEGSLFSDGYGSSFTPEFEVPKGSGRHTIFTGGLWFGGMDAGGTLKVAGMTYRQTGVDFWPGPLNSLAVTDSATIADYDRVWKVNKCDADNYTSWVQGGSVGTNPLDSAANEVISSWPAFGPEGQPIAPFLDLNGNGNYEPLLGEVPEIKGDQAIFFIYNDKGGVHTETGGASIGLEIQGMAYAYSCINDSALSNTIFLNYTIINKSSFRLDSAFVGNWTDFDIGSAMDDYVECDVTRGAYYGYNGDLIDDSAPAGQIPYGANPPAQAVVFLAGPYADSNGVDDVASSVPPNFLNYGNAIVDDERLGMSRFLYYNNDASPTGNPSSATDFYNYMAATWKDATPWTYGGNGHLTGIPCNYIFPGTSDPMGYGTNMIPQPQWDEITEGNVPSDRRGIGSFGPFTLQPGEVRELDFAYVFGRATSGGNLASVAVMKEYIDTIRNRFGGPNMSCGCDGLTSINNIEAEESFNLYPNPSSDILNVEASDSFEDFTLQIFDVTGRLVQKKEHCFGFQTLQIHGLNSGIYLLNLRSEKGSISKRFVKQ